MAKKITKKERKALKEIIEGRIILKFQLDSIKEIEDLQGDASKAKEKYQFLYDTFAKGDWVDQQWVLEHLMTRIEETA